MTFNWIVVFGAAFVPLIVGSIWYNPKVLGTAWIKSTGLTEEQLRGGNMPLIFGLTYLFGLFVAMALTTITIHQMNYPSVFQGDPTANDPNSATGKMITEFFKNYGGNFRTFKHGALHGGISAILLALPIIGILALFERKSFKYIAIHVGYWFVTLMLMGGLICQFL